MPSFLSIPDEEFDRIWRVETKYRLSLRKYFALRNAIIPYMKPDMYTQRTATRKYLVRSLYFDTQDYCIYREKVNGNSDRIKLRIRTYGTKAEDNPDIRIELKVRKSNLMEKYGTFVSMKDYQNFIESDHWSDNQDPVLIEFERLVHHWTLQPKTLVQYLREGFQSREKDDVRVTFDHHIASAPANELYPQKISWRRQYEQQVVLEIKHHHKIPSWMLNLIQSYDLKVVANSKFTSSIEAASNDIVLVG